jgi:TatA/E family protein of Tat protein translocase
VPFGLGTPELLIILVLALLILGPKKLPEVGRTLGKGMRDFKNTMSDIEDVKKSTIGQVDELKDSLKVDLTFDEAGEKAKPKSAPAKEPGTRAG